MVSTEDLTAEKLFSVKGFVAVVTGGGTGIGLMATQALAANGARVYITGRRMEVLQNAANTHSPTKGGEIIPLSIKVSIIINGRWLMLLRIGPCDVTRKEDIENLVAQISEKEPFINLLVTAAGIMGPKAEPESNKASELKDTLFNSESFSEWSDTYNTNVSSVYFTTVAFLPLLQSGVYVQILIRVNRSKLILLPEVKKAGIRVNSIAPGYFPSELTTHESDENQKSHIPQEYIDSKGHIPMRRAGDDEEMAQGIIFLAKNNYVNGEVIAIDGGVLLDIPR
ncbi:hypothetical protein B7494_g7934 [Chlorociboria aeruginascens]|nr:hypothetical protein B7494_g7934 [Chlorociboria aeruginascens]